MPESGGAIGLGVGVRFCDRRPESDSVDQRSAHQVIWNVALSFGRCVASPQQGGR
jgi:hypothetical protein